MELVGAERLATGHYARLERLADGSVALLRAVDERKDQSYALALVPYAALARAVFPPGGLAKTEVRAHAERLGLAVWDKPESQDLCFVPDRDYAGFMVRSLGETRGSSPGVIETPDGRRLGSHPGIIHYTVGQRRGLGLASSEPLYVLEIDARRNAVVVGGRADLERPGLVTGPVNWLTPAPPANGTRVDVKIRAHHAPAAARLAPRPDGSAEVRFERPQAAVTPGQLAVLYDGERVIGGGVIDHALDAGGGPAARAGGMLAGSGYGRGPEAAGARGG